MSAPQISRIVVNLDGREYLVEYRVWLFYRIEVVEVVSAMGLGLPLEEFFTFEAVVELVLDEGGVSI